VPATTGTGRLPEPAEAGRGADAARRAALLVLLAGLDAFEQLAQFLQSSEGAESVGVRDAFELLSDLRELRE